MTGIAVLAVIALFQLAFLVLLIVFVGVRRQVDRKAEAEFLVLRQGVSGPLGAWLTGTGPVEEVVATLRILPGTSALGIAGNLARTSMPPAQRSVLAAALRDEHWARSARDGASSRQWGKRLQAARCFALTGALEDAPQLERLLNDPRPAVAVAAVSALPRVANAALVERVLDRLVMLPVVVRVYLQDALRELRPMVEPVLVKRLTIDAPPRALAIWIDLSGALELASALERVPTLAAHDTARVRVAVARALRRVPTRATTEVLYRLLADTDDQVRAAAAHSLGELGSALAIPALLGAARDPSWFVRFRAALALSQLGEQGRAAVRTLRIDDDRYVADIASLISGLGDGALLDMVES